MIHHLTPGALSICCSLNARSWFLTVSAQSSLEREFSTRWLLEMNLCSRNFPVLQSCFASFTRRIASSSETKLIRPSPDQSHVTASGPFRNLHKTPTSVLVNSGPVNRWSFNETPSYFAEQLNTTLIFPGFWGWYTP